jgi:hypothetical protein
MYSNSGLWAKENVFKLLIVGQDERIQTLIVGQEKRIQTILSPWHIIMSLNTFSLAYNQEFEYVLLDP